MFNFVIIGCGRISHKIAEGIASNKEKVILVGLCDVIESKMSETEKTYREKSGYLGEIKKYTDYKEMIKNEKIDVAIISTESGYHEEIGLYCLENGINTIIEKPLAMSIEGAQKLVDKAKEKGLKLAASHQNRFNYPVQLLKKAIEEKKLGRIFNGVARILWTRDENYYLQAPWRGTWELDGGTLMNQCIHNIDLLNWMMDSEIDTVYAQTANYIRNIEAEDYGVIIIRYKNGCIGTIEGSAVIYPKNLEETLTITGETGTVVIGGMAVNKINTWRVKGDNEEEFLGIDSGDPNSVYGYGHRALYKDFIEALEENREPLVSGIQGMSAVKIILAAYKSQKIGMPVKFDEFREFRSLDMEDEEIKVR
ncbi:MULTISPECIES: Gfo/Idh/MocA family protein [Fusobacterium]|uniref:Gfo/Idh/MocA family protein n=1 Tax=Fusobacterium TaxID=848 RepID=UPI00147736C3|nr:MULTISPECIES: Gfo/Idh/MocA family oxidoreductase [Fusobacterium]NME35809.1 Gfo/Idh/MocA family oxidoreductase [Fusobacterium sp. FSA-380-WT-3A]